MLPVKNRRVSLCLITLLVEPKIVPEVLHHLSEVRVLSIFTLKILLL